MNSSKPLLYSACKEREIRKQQEPAYEKFMNAVLPYFLAFTICYFGGHVAWYFLRN